jgi:hypothetical protein
MEVMVAEDILLMNRMNITLCLMVVMLRRLYLLSPDFLGGSSGSLIRLFNITAGPKKSLNFWRDRKQYQTP